MKKWSIDTLLNCCPNLHQFSDEKQMAFLELMNIKFPPSTFEHHLQLRRSAIDQMTNSKETLNGATQQFPPLIKYNQIKTDINALKGYAIVFTAGGEGERLRLSLLDQGYSPQALEDFTKATFPLPDFFEDFGALQTNLAMISNYCALSGIDIPIIVTTGPQDSITARVIPRILKNKNYFNLKNIKILPQQERLHFTMDEKILCCESDGTLSPVTQPDETGGPLMMLKQVSEKTGQSVLDWMEKLNCNKLIVVQATALYDQELLPVIANALGNHDCMGVGIQRKIFAPKDPFGTFVELKKGNQRKTQIIEQNVRNEETLSVKDQSGSYYLPFNTGFYAFTNKLLRENDLPDYATPPKEILPGYQRSPKIGYAATDLLPLAKEPIVLAIEPQMFGVLKTADDLKMLSELGKQFGLDKLCRNMVKSSHL